MADSPPPQTADDENKRLRTTLIGVSVAIVLLVFAVSYLGGDGDEDSSAAVYSPSPSRSHPAPTSDASAGRRHGERHGASSGRNQAGETGGSTNYYRGLTRDDIVALGRMADLTGYGLSPITPLSFSQASDFAIAVTVTCDAVAAGQTTWTDAVNEDIASGAPPSAARQMNDYLRVVFCPKATS